MKNIYDNTSNDCAKLVTKAYSTSFSLAIQMLSPEIRPSIYAIYGFVRLADEIVDTFHDYPSKKLWDKFESDYRESLELKISLNPILNAFQHIVHKYSLHDLVEPFLYSMKLDLDKKNYLTESEYKDYIYGSADVVGLMCLKVFVNGDTNRYDELKIPAMKLGSAFQKINFLRDIKYDFENLGRVYFPGIDFNQFTKEDKAKIIQDIEDDLNQAWLGVQALPFNAKFGVTLAYQYYTKLLKKIKNLEVNKIFQERIRIPNVTKFYLLLRTYLFPNLK